MKTELCDWSNIAASKEFRKTCITSAWPIVITV